MLTNLPTSDHKYELTTQGAITRLISDVPLIVNDHCRDNKRDNHVLSVTFGADKRTAQAQEYVILNKELQIENQLLETVRGGTPRLMCSPDGSPWVRLMSFSSDFTKDVVLPVYNREALRDAKKVSIETFRQELLWDGAFVSFGYDPANRHAGKPDDLVLWEFDKNGLFKKRTKSTLKFSCSGVLLKAQETLYVCNFTPDRGTVSLTEIDKSGNVPGQWLSEPVTGVQKLIPVTASEETCSFIVLTEQNCFVQMEFSKEGKKLSETRISELPQDLLIEQMKLLHTAKSGTVSFSYASRNTNGLIRWNGRETVLQITASGENNELSTAVRGERELDLPYRTEISVIDDDLIMLSPFNYYSNEIGTVIFMR